MLFSVYQKKINRCPGLFDPQDAYFVLVSDRNIRRRTTFSSHTQSSVVPYISVFSCSFLEFTSVKTRLDRNSKWYIDITVSLGKYHKTLGNIGVNVCLTNVFSMKTIRFAYTHVII